MAKELTIIGATGSLSTRVTKQLMAHGMQLKIVARNPDKARRLFGEDIDVVYGDVEDIGSLHKALAGSRAVYIHLNTEVVSPEITFYPEREGVANIVEAAESNGVEHLIQIAGIESLQPDFFTNGVVMTEPIRRAGMERVSASSIPHTFLSCSMFLDSFPRIVTDSTFAIFGNTKNRVHFTNTEQLATHLFHIAGNPRAFGRNIPVQGSQGIDIVTAAQMFFGAFEPSVQVVQLPMEALDGLGLPTEEAAFIAHVMSVTMGLQEVFISGEIHEEFGAPTLDISQFASQLREEQ